MRELVKSKKSGVYKISNTKNGKYYIGSTKNFHRRYCVHLSSLRKNKHHCRHLQNSWNKNDEEDFLFEILVETNLDTREKVEQEILDSCFTDPGCYNSSPKAVKTSKDTRAKEELKRIYGRRKSDEERKKISNSHKGIRILKDRGYNEEVKIILRCIIEDKELPENLRTPQISYRQLREAYDKWNKGSKNLELRHKQKQEKKRLKMWLSDQGLWYDARSDSWDRKNTKDKENAIKILKANQYKSSVYQKCMKIKNENTEQRWTIQEILISLTCA